MLYKDAPREIEEGRIARYFPTAEYDDAMVREALQAARAVARQEAFATHGTIEYKDRRPPWGTWDGRIDFRTDGPTLCGVEVEVPADNDSQKVVAMIRHTSTGAVPGNSGDPTGLRRQILTYIRPVDWRKPGYPAAGTKLSSSAWELTASIPEPADGFIIVSDCFQCVETWWYPTREAAEKALPSKKQRTEGASSGPRLAMGAGDSFPPRVYIRSVSLGA